MKPRLLTICCIGFALVGASCLVASLALFRAHAVALHSLERITDSLSKADSVELIDLTNKPSDESKRIITAESRGEYYTAKKRTLTSIESKELISLLSEHIYTTESRAGCHDPGELVILRSGNKKVLEFTLCFKCTNIEFYPYPYLGAVVMLFDSQPAPVELARLKAFIEKQKSEANK